MAGTSQGATISLENSLLQKSMNCSQNGCRAKKWSVRFHCDTAVPQELWPTACATELLRQPFAACKLEAANFASPHNIGNPFFGQTALPVLFLSTWVPPWIQKLAAFKFHTWIQVAWSCAHDYSSKWGQTHRCLHWLAMFDSCHRAAISQVACD